SNVKGNTYVDTTVVNGTTYYYVVSATNSFGDSADSNEASATPKVASDLILSSFTVPSTGGGGLTMSLSDTTPNQRPGTSNPTTRRSYLSRSSTIDATAVVLDAAHAVPSLPPGASSSASVTVDIPNVPIGYYYIIGKADADNIENETNESNNTVAKFVT